jgi:hypothetical protein
VFLPAKRLVCAAPANCLHILSMAYLHDLLRLYSLVLLRSNDTIAMLRSQCRCSVAGMQLACCSQRRRARERSCALLVGFSGFRALLHCALSHGWRIRAARNRKRCRRRVGASSRPSRKSQKCSELAEEKPRPAPPRKFGGRAAVLVRPADLRSLGSPASKLAGFL